MVHSNLTLLYKINEEQSEVRLDGEPREDSQIRTQLGHIGKWFAWKTLYKELDQTLKRRSSIRSNQNVHIIIQRTLKIESSRRILQAVQSSQAFTWTSDESTDLKIISLGCRTNKQIFKIGSSGRSTNQQIFMIISAVRRTNQRTLKIGSPRR